MHKMDIKMVVYKQNNITYNCNLNISETKVKVMAFIAKHPCK
jgi:hypothetical protein